MLSLGGREMRHFTYYPPPATKLHFPLIDISINGFYSLFSPVHCCYCQQMAGMCLNMVKFRSREHARVVSNIILHLHTWLVAWFIGLSHTRGNSWAAVDIKRRSEGTTSNRRQASGARVLARERLAFWGEKLQAGVFHSVLCVNKQISQYFVNKQMFCM